MMFLLNIPGGKFKMGELGKVLILAQRDLLKFVRDRGRIVASFIFPVIFLGVFGVTLNAGFGSSRLGFNYIDYVFSGMLLQSIFQSAFAGITSLVQDREKDFAMSIFVAPVSRYSIVFGKILGESMVAFAQIFGMIIFAKLMGMSFPILTIIHALPVALLGSFVGASFGMLIASRMNTADNAQRIFPFLIFPMIFLSGAFTPVNHLPLILNILKSVNPIYYGVDLMRNVMFSGLASHDLVVSNSIGFDLIVFIILGIVFFFVGSFLFTQKEGNR